MMRNLLLTVFLCTSLCAYSQNQSWNANAINGQNYNIDSIVDAGKTVLVDIGENSCSGCWDWHISGIMEKIYHEFGPNGTNDLEIFLIDGASTSSIACLQGACLGSLGNWIAGTPYPIIGPYGQGYYVQSQYTFPAFPTLFMHCPGLSQGVVISREETFDEFLDSWHDACPAAFSNGTIDPMLFHNDDVEFCAGTHPFADLFNQGTDTLFAATITLKQNGNLVDTKNWTGALPPFQHTRVSFDNYIYSTAGTFEKEVLVANDAQAAGNIETDSYTPAPVAPNVNLTFEIKTDVSAFETKWKLFDENGSVVASSPATNYSTYTLYTYNWNLNPNSCYTFQLYDSVGGNGICCNLGQGYYRIRNAADSTDNFIYGGSFTAFMQQHKFFTPAATTGISSENSAKDNFQVYPNPTNGIVKINLPKETEATVHVVNVLGETVMSTFINKSTGSSVDLHTLNNGFYWMRIITADEMIIRSVTLNK